MQRRSFLKGTLGVGAGLLFRADLFAAALSAGNAPKTLVLGGGMFALGYALAHPQETLVLERGIHLGLDYAGTVGPFTPGTPTTALGAELVAQMTEAQILKEGVMELPPLADFLAVFFQEHGGQSFMNAELVGLEKQTSGYRVRILGGGTEGIAQFDVGGFVDTTDVGWRNFGADAVTTKRFGGIAHDFAYFAVDLPPTAGWHEARMSLYDAWQAAGHQPKDLLAEVNAIKCFYRDLAVRSESGPYQVVQRRNEDLGYTWVPSGQFPDLITAFEEGYKWKAV